MSNGIECGGSGLARNRCLTTQGTLIRVFAVVLLLCVDRERGRVHVILNRKDHLWLEALRHLLLHSASNNTPQTLLEKTYNHNTYTSQVPQLNRTIPNLTTQSLLAIGVKN